MIIVDLDLDQCPINRRSMFDFAAHRRVEHYSLIVERTAAMPLAE